MSIRLLLDGHDFSDSAARLRQAVPSESNVSLLLTIDTPETVLVPRDLFLPGAEERYLQLCGINCPKDSSLITSSPDAPVVAVMACDRELVQFIRENYGERVSFTSPLLETIDEATRSLQIFLTGNCAYVTYRKGEKLLYAEALPDPAPLSVLYYVRHLDQLFGLSRSRISIAGDHAEEVFQEVNHYYRRCEIVAAPCEPTASNNTRGNTQ